MTDMLALGGLMIVSPYDVGSETLAWTVNYQGFDGLAWPGQSDEFIDECLVPISRLREIEIMFGELSKDLGARLLFLREKAEIAFMNDDFEFIGFDVGVFESCYNNFSCIYNELLGNLLPSFNEFKNHINGFGLFDEDLEAASFMRERANINSSEFETFQAGDRLRIIEVYRHRR